MPSIIKVYDGSIRNGRLTGSGIIINTASNNPYSNVTIYEGEFQKSILHGAGRMVTYTGNSLIQTTGNFNNGTVIISSATVLEVFATEIRTGSYIGARTVGNNPLEVVSCDVVVNARYTPENNITISSV